LRVVPVIDLMHGQVVRGVAGNRSEYRPVVSRLAADASPAAVAAAFAKLGFREAYVADLDAIAGRPANQAGYHAIRAAGLASLAIDAGITSIAQAAALVDGGPAEDTQPAPATSVVCGLESVATPELLAELLALLGPRRLIFSLDLKAGQPLTTSPAWAAITPLQIAHVALSLGVRRLIVLDLADVGTASGTRTQQLIGEILAAQPEAEVWAGGGVRNRDDLLNLERLGVAAALVASALHDGRLGPADLSGFVSG